MKKYYLSFIAILISLYSFGQVNPQSKSVRPYVKKNGTYVQPHRRTVENRTNRDNYTTTPNYNPYTGKKGTRTPDNNFNYSKRRTK